MAVAKGCLEPWQLVEVGRTLPSNLQRESGWGHLDLRPSLQDRERVCFCCLELPGSW